MGFFDKVKGAVQQLKEENAGAGSAMKRMNDAEHFAGNINRRIKDGDFKQTAYLNFYWDEKKELKPDGTSNIGVSNFRGLIYGSGQEDVEFVPSEVESVSQTGFGQKVSGKESITYTIKFKDGRTAEADILVTKSAIIVGGKQLTQAELFEHLLK